MTETEKHEAVSAGLQLAIVVPTYCERGNVRPLAELIAAALPGVAYEIVFVDDDSPDGTFEAVRVTALTDPHVRGIRRVGRRGLSGACIEGALSTLAPVVAIIDGDLQHDETLLPVMLGHIRDGADMVVASRYAEGARLEGLSAVRGFGSRAATWLVRSMLRVKVTDPLSGFFMLRREHWDALAPRLSRDGFKLQMDILSLGGRGLKLVEVPTQLRDRAAGESKMDALVTVQFAGLLLSHATGSVLPPQFVLFALIGGTGIGTHLLTLEAMTYAGFAFGWAQAAATLVAMTGNYILNNAITYSEQRLRGVRFWTGLLSFYLVCGVGAVANVGVGTLLFNAHAPLLVAGLVGAVTSAVFNYATTRLFTWRQY